MKKKYLIIDWSPVAYGNLFGATSLVKKDQELRKLVKKDQDGKYNLDQYKDVVISKIIEEFGAFRNQFGLSENDEIILATDTPSKDGYWRKDIWAGYKSKRKDTRDKSNIQWNKAFDLFEELLDLFDSCSGMKVIRTPRTEGDDIIFVLTEHLSKLEEDNEVIIVSSDHDFIQCLLFDNVKFWRTTRTIGMDKSSFYEATQEELEDVVKDHVISGDPNDGFYHIKSFSRFSKEFLEMYPQYEGKELKVYEKRFQLDEAFKKKTGTSAYSHPRFGYKSFKKTKKNIHELLKENKIFEMNYKMNKDLALPEKIPESISKNIIKDFEISKSGADYGCLTEYFTRYGLIELIAHIGFL